MGRMGLVVGMRLFVLILAVRLRVLGRSLAANAFVVFALGPLLLGATLWIVDRFLPGVRGPLAELLATGQTPGPIGLALALAMTFLAVPAITRELFPARHADAALDVLPVPETVRGLVALAGAAARLLPAAAFLGVLLVALSGWRWTLSANLGGRLGAAVVTLAPAALLAAAGRVRLLGARRRAAILAGALGVLVLAVLLLEPGPRRALLLPWWSAAAQLEAALGIVLDLPALEGAANLGGVRGGVVAGGTGLLLGLAAGGLVVGYRRRDLERGERLPGSGHRTRRTYRHLVPHLRAMRRPLGAQVQRDLRLVVRRFSPAVYLAAAAALLFLATAVLVVPRLNLGPLVTRRAMVAVTLTAVLSLAALAPLLLRHQLPRLWIEKSTPVRWEDVWLAKAVLAPLLASPAIAGGAAALVAIAAELGGPGLGAALLQLLVTGWIVASTVGLAAFEIAEQPILGLFFSTLVSLAIAALFLVAPHLWWMWSVLYFAVAGKLAERATGRVRGIEVAR